jgi:Transposase
VSLVVQARRCFCEASTCLRRIFVESLPGGLACDARQTERWRQARLELAHASRAEVAARVARRLGIRARPDTLIRQQRAAPLVFAAPRGLGVDELALRRGGRDGTLLVALEQRRPIAVLAGRPAEPLTTWQRAPPTGAIVVRERADAYALAGRQAAPDALQVADRFHLLRHVGDRPAARGEASPLLGPPCEDGATGQGPRAAYPAQACQGLLKKGHLRCSKNPHPVVMTPEKAIILPNNQTSSYGGIVAVPPGFILGGRMARQRTHDTADCKAKVAVAAMKGQPTVNEMAATYGVHSNQVLQWKTQALEVVLDVFSSRRARGPGRGSVASATLPADWATQSRTRLAQKKVGLPA